MSYRRKKRDKATTFPDKLIADQKRPRPKNQHELGLCTYSSQFVAELAGLAKPLTETT
jgi:hypothetical protein